MINEALLIFLPNLSIHSSNSDLSLDPNHNPNYTARPRRTTLAPRPSSLFRLFKRTKSLDAKGDCHVVCSHPKAAYTFTEPIIITSGRPSKASAPHPDREIKVEPVKMAAIDLNDPFDGLDQVNDAAEWKRRENLIATLYMNSVVTHAVAGKLGRNPAHMDLAAHLFLSMEEKYHFGLNAWKIY